ncbi:MAG: hypothetical protein AAGC70_12390 [Pseudomonadota bacterium]
MRSRLRRRPDGNEAGFVLVSVLALIGLVAALAVFVSQRAREQLREADHAKVMFQVQEHADSVARWMAWRLARRQPIAVGFGDAAPEAAVICRMADARISLRARQADGLFDLNAAPRPLLAALIQTMGLTQPADAGRVATEIVDFRDSDRVDASTGDSEAARYIAAGRAFGPKNAPFAKVLELDQLPSMTDDLLQRLVPHVTVSSGLPGVDWRKVPVSVKQAMSDKINTSLFNSIGRAGVFRILVTAVGERAHHRAYRRMVIRRASRTQRGYVLLDWSTYPWVWDADDGKPTERHELTACVDGS